MKSNRRFFAISILAAAFSFYGCNGRDANLTGNGQASESGALFKKKEHIGSEAAEAVKAASKKTRTIVCDSSEYTLEGKTFKHNKAFRPEVIDAKLARLPQAREALGFDHVSSCEEGQRFTEYMNKNPELNEMFDPYPVKDYQPIMINQDSSIVPLRPEALQKASIYRAAGQAEHNGVVEIFGGPGICTGAILDSRTIITSAHCVYEPGKGDNFTRLMNIMYYDPADGQSWARYLVDHANVYVRIHPPWTGDGDYQSDIAVITIAGSSPSTTIYDNVRVYNDRMPGTYVVYWGRGYNDPKGTGSGVLRYSSSTGYTIAGTYYLATGTSNQQQCHGDSGGPLFRDDANYNFTVALQSSVSAFTGECAANGATEYSTILAAKIPWITSAVEITCYYMTTAATGTKYIRCF